MANKSETNGHHYPEIVISTMASGGVLKGNEFLPGIPIEMIAFRINKPDANTSGIHGPLHWDASSVLYHLGTDASLGKKLDRAFYFLTMSKTKDVLGQIEASNQDIYLVLHPDTAAGLLGDLIDEKVVLPPNAILAIENDDELDHSFQVNKLIQRGLLPDSASNPSSLECLKALSNLSRSLNLPTYTVLDLEHLAHYDPRITLPQAIEALGGIDLLHLSGEGHQGLCVPEIAQLNATVMSHNPRPLLKTILEGPTPPFLVPSQSHTEEVFDLYHESSYPTDN